MQICSATMGFAVKDRYLTKTFERANVMELHACVRCFQRKDGTLIVLKTMSFEVANLTSVDTLLAQFN